MKKTSLKKSVENLFVRKSVLVPLQKENQIAIARAQSFFCIYDKLYIVEMADGTRYMRFVGIDDEYILQDFLKMLGATNCIFQMGDIPNVAKEYECELPDKDFACQRTSFINAIGQSAERAFRRRYWENPRNGNIPALKKIIAYENRI